MFQIFLAAEGSAVLNSSTGSEAVSAATTAAAQADQATGGFLSGISGPVGMLIYIVAIIAIFYFFAFRPQLKKDKAMKALQSSIKVGDSVMTTSGFYGKVVDISEQVFVLEFGLNKGVRIPVSKNEIVGIKEPNLTNKPSEDEEKKDK